MKEYVVRVVQTEDKEGGEISYAFIESLRYAGIVKVHETDPHGLTILCFDLICPHNGSSKTWAEMNAERMRSFGFNAVVAPRS